MVKITHTIVDSINSIGQRTWEKLFPDNLEGFGFFKSTEESGLREFSFSYAVIYENGAPVLIAPLFTADFNMDVAIDGPLRKAVIFLRKFFPRLLIIRTLFCGSPFGENGVIGITPGRQDQQALILELARIIEKIMARDKLPQVIFKDFLARDTSHLDVIQKRGFFRTESLPSVSVDLAFNDFDEYLQSLSHNRRKDLRRKMKKVREADAIEVKVTDNVDLILEDIYRLYLNTYNAGTVRFEKLTPEFFRNISKGLGGNALFFLYYANGALAAFNMCFRSKDTLIDKFIGFDYPLALKYNLYFYSWCYNIQWCLENKARHYQIGQTDYEAKLKLGGKVIPLFAYLKHRNPLMHMALKIVAGLSGPQASNKDLDRDAH